jgi:hypothetical protein
LYRDDGGAGAGEAGYAMHARGFQGFDQAHRGRVVVRRRSRGSGIECILIQAWEPFLACLAIE